MTCARDMVAPEGRVVRRLNSERQSEEMYGALPDGLSVEDVAQALNVSAVKALISSTFKVGDIVIQFIHLLLEFLGGGLVLFSEATVGA